VGVRPVADQSAALRLVVLADRLYDRDIPVLTSGVPLDRLFPDELLAGRLPQEGTLRSRLPSDGPCPRGCIAVDLLKRLWLRINKGP
jgi:predicted ATPase